MQSITLRFLAGQTGSQLAVAGKVRGGTVVCWMDEAGFACATGWSRGPCAMVWMGNASFLRPIDLGDLVEVQARLAYTGHSSMAMSLEVTAAHLPGDPMVLVSQSVAVYVALGTDGRPCPVDNWRPETPGDIALAQQVRMQVDSARSR